MQLVGGSYEAERVRLPDPLVVAQRWAAAGLTSLHIVDLDAALGRGSNTPVIAALARQPGLELQVGGGVRALAAIERLFELGVQRVVVGTCAVEDASWLEAMAARFPRQLVAAADVRGTSVVTQGWTKTSPLTIDALLQRLADLPLAGVLVTACMSRGSCRASTPRSMRGVCAAATMPIIASGGITTMEDLRQLRELGAHAAVIGMALYTGRLDANALAQEFTS